MSATIELPRPAHTLGKPQPLDDRRAVALADFNTRLENLRACVHWLVEHDVTVLASTLCRAGAIVTVSGSTRLHQLLGHDSSWRKRRQDGALTVYTCFSVRFGTRVEWEEVRCA